MQSNKPKVIKDFDKLDKEIQNQVKQLYPSGFAEYLISYTDPKTGLERFALPYETEDRYYMIRMDDQLEQQIDSRSDDDDDFGKTDDILGGLDLGKLPDDIKSDNSDDDEEEEKPDTDTDTDGDDEDDDEISDDEEDEEDDEK